jgi:zinc protease
VIDLSVLDQRPSPGVPRPYHFPRFRRTRLTNGLTVISVPMPGRPLLAAELILEGGAVSEPQEQAGVTWLAARALSEGTSRHDANAFIEATERLGAAISSGSSWEVLTCSLAVPRRHLEPALGLLAEMLLEPGFPEAEVDRLRAQRLNDLLQAAADPARRAERVLTETLYAPGAAYRRPLGGDEVTVPGLGRDIVMARHLGLLDPGRATLVVAGDLEGIDAARLAERLLGGWQRAEAGAGPPSAGAQATGEGIAPDEREPERRRVILVDRPGAAQTEVRVGQVGLPRHIDDFHAVVVLQTMLGGLFNSRLQRLLREVRGFTYHVSAGFAFRRAAGPFAVRSAVQTEVTIPAIRDILEVLGALAKDPPTPEELAVARDYLVGVFPLRFEESDRVAGAVADLVALGLPDDEFDRYRPGVAAVTADDVVRAATHIRPEDNAIVLVGDAARIGSAIDEFGPLTVIKDGAGAPS